MTQTIKGVTVEFTLDNPDANLISKLDVMHEVLTTECGDFFFSVDIAAEGDRKFSVLFGVPTPDGLDDAEAFAIETTDDAIDKAMAAIGARREESDGFGAAARNTKVDIFA